VAAHPPAAESVDSDNLYRALNVFMSSSVTQPSASDLALCRQLVTELDRRGAMRPADRRRWHETLLEYGRVEEARADIAKHPGLGDSSIPGLVPLAASSGDDARYWVWDKETNVLHEHAVDLAHGTHLVVDASPGCHFCPLAAAAIEQDPRLARLFRDALWI